MKKQKGEMVLVALLLVAAVMVTGRAAIPELDFSAQAPGGPVYHNYNGGFSK